jgi:hypothetical protein
MKRMIDLLKRYNATGVLRMNFTGYLIAVFAGMGAENMARTRYITLNMLRQEKTCKKGIKAKRFKAALDSDYAEKSHRLFFKRLCSCPVYICLLL